VDPAHHPSPELIEAVALGRDISPDLRRHIETCPECAPQLAQFRANNEFLADLLVAVEPRHAALADRPAESVPGYRIISPISAGGQGVVYKAVQERTGRVVALKMLTGGWFATEKQRRRFEREIDIAASLRHPNIATVYDAVELRTGLHAFAMEYIDGVPLDRWEPGSRAPHTSHAARGTDGSRTVEFMDPLPPPPPRREVPREVRFSRATIEAKLRLFIKVCDAVHHAHQRGIIHRDLKPNNILADAMGEPHVLDFGIAVFAGEGEGEGRVTQSGEFTGTVEFASPEQAGGEPTGIDFRTDIYSLGVILYATLTGALPYDLQGHTLERLRTIQHEPPRRPGLIDASLRGDLETIILKALDKDRTRRYQTAAELGDDINRFLAGDPIWARRDSLLYVLGKRAARHKVKLSLTAATILAAAAGLASFMRERAVWREREAEARNALLIKDAETARALARTEQKSIARMGTVISGAFGADGRTLSDAEAQRLKESAARLNQTITDARSGLSATADAELRLALAGIYRDARLYRDANFQLGAVEAIAGALEEPAGFSLRARAEAIRATMTTPESPDGNGPDLLRYAAALLARDDGEGALRASQEAAAAFRSGPVPDEAGALRAEDLAARALLRLGRAEEAERAATAVVETLRGVPGAASGAFPAWTTVAEARAERGNEVGVWNALTNALIAFVALPDLPPGMADAMTPLTAYPIESPREGVRGPARVHGPAIARATIELLRAFESGRTLDSADRLLAIAGGVAAAFDASLALPFVPPAVSMYEKELGTDDPRLIAALWRAGRMFADGGDPESATRTMEKALSLAPESLGGTFPEDHFSHAGVLSLAYASLDRWADMARIRRADCEHRAAEPRRDRLGLAACRLGLARALTFAGDPNGALEVVASVPSLLEGRGDDADAACLKSRLAHDRALALAFAGDGAGAVTVLDNERATCDGKRSLALAYGPMLRAIEGVVRGAAGQRERAEQAFAESLPTLMTSSQAALHRPLFRRAASMYESWGRADKAAELRAFLTENSAP